MNNYEILYRLWSCIVRSKEKAKRDQSIADFDRHAQYLSAVEVTILAAFPAIGEGLIASFLARYEGQQMRRIANGRN